VHRHAAEYPTNGALSWMSGSYQGANEISQPSYNPVDRAARAVLAPNVAMMTFFLPGASSVQP
jgi:hypothetical protein